MNCRVTTTPHNTSLSIINTLQHGCWQGHVEFFLEIGEPLAVVQTTLFLAHDSLHKLNVLVQRGHYITGQEGRVKVRGLIFLQSRHGPFKTSQDQMISAKGLARIEIILNLKRRLVNVELQKSSTNRIEVFQRHSFFRHAFVGMARKNLVMAERIPCRGNGMFEQSFVARIDYPHGHDRRGCCKSLGHTVFGSR